MALDLRNPGFTITFDSKGGTDVAPQNQMYGELLKEPENPTREGYVSDGWYTDFACDDLWEEDKDIIECDITLYAGWKKDKVVMLDDIAIYTDTEEVPLREVFAKIYEKENAVLSFDTKSATPEELVEYFESVMPDYDRERVYLTHIKKIYSWYNILVANGVVDFAKSEDAAEESAE